MVWYHTKIGNVLSQQNNTTLFPFFYPIFIDRCRRYFETDEVQNRNPALFGNHDEPCPPPAGLSVQVPGPTAIWCHVAIPVD
eukprot:scaffold42761_cov160-Amphora_coffeaeformis.AAC.4